jgi:hypothetical protein
LSLLKVLATPWLLRRLVKANEKAANALEDIAAALNTEFGIVKSPSQEAADDDDDYSVSTDQDTYEREVGPRRRSRRDSEE